jgi:hypothetical protein
MFVSRAEAEKRLQDDKNLLRPAGDAQSGNPSEVEGQKDELTPESANKGNTGEIEASTELNDEDDFNLPCLSDLDKIIASGASFLGDGRAHYKKKPDAQRAIGEVSTLLGPTIAARTLGLSIPQAFAYEHGEQTTNLEMSKGLPELKKHLESVKLDIAVKASHRLRKIVKCITTDKIENVTDPLKLASLGKDMAVIIDKMAPSEGSVDGGLHLHVYRPEAADVSAYKVVNARVSGVIDVGAG